MTVSISYLSSWFDVQGVPKHSVAIKVVLRSIELCTMTRTLCKHGALYLFGVSISDSSFVMNCCLKHGVPHASKKVLNATSDRTILKIIQFLKLRSLLNFLCLINSCFWRYVSSVHNRLHTSIGSNGLNRSKLYACRKKVSRSLLHPESDQRTE